MAEEPVQLETRIVELTAQLAALGARVERLESRLGYTSPAPLPATPPPAEPVFDMEGPTDVSEEVLSWAARTHLLPRLSTLCFLLVVALILRTITDNNIINTLLGSVLGMGYAALLMGTGWSRYQAKSPLAPIFAACGAALMALIVVETHTRFDSLPLVPAYLTLMATGIGMAAISARYNVLVPISVGTLGMCLAGAAIDYPNPFFPYLSMILWTANVLGFFAARIHRCSWLRWIVLLVSLVMLHLWGIKLGLILARGESPPAHLAVTWFLPVLAVFAATFLVLALFGIIRSGIERVTRFDYTLPTVNGIWAFSAAYYVINAAGWNRTLLGAVGVAAAAGHLGVGVWLARRGVERAPGTNAFAFGGSAILALSLPAMIGSTLATLPILAGMGFAMAFLAGHWRSGGVRITSYAIQLYAATTLAMLQYGKAPSGPVFAAAGAGAAVAILAALHYRWCRLNPPPPRSEVFCRYDGSDRLAVVLLLAALGSAFFSLRAVIYWGLLTAPGVLENSFHCAQTVLINAAATGLMVFAYYRGNREVRNVAILLTLIGAIKVFLYDMLGTHGVPLVASVLSFGITAALESVALGRWQKGGAATAQTESRSEAKEN